MSLDLTRVDFSDHVLGQPRLERQSTRVEGVLVDLFDFFVADDGLDLGVRVVDDQLLNGLVGHLGTARSRGSSMRGVGSQLTVLGPINRELILGGALHELLWLLLSSAIGDSFVIEVGAYLRNLVCLEKLITGQ